MIENRGEEKFRKKKRNFLFAAKADCGYPFFEAAIIKLISAHVTSVSCLSVN